MRGAGCVRLWLVLVAAVVLVAGCSSERTKYGAPRVANPVDYSRVLQDPCVLVDMAHLEQLGIMMDDPNDKMLSVNKDSSSSCSWWDRKGRQLIVTFFSGESTTSAESGLDKLYSVQEFPQKKHNKNFFQLFQEQQPIQGLPVVLLGTEDKLDEGTCELAVGLSDSRYVSITIMAFTAAPQQWINTACDTARQAADIVVTSIKNS